MGKEKAALDAANGSLSAKDSAALEEANLAKLLAGMDEKASEKTNEKTPEAQAAAKPPADSEPAAKPSKGTSTGAFPQAGLEDTAIFAASQGMDFLHAAIRRKREESEAKAAAYVPPPMTQRQREKLEAESKAGAAAVARHAEQLANRPQVKPDPQKEGFSTPVRRPGDHVPAM